MGAAEGIERTLIDIVAKCLRIAPHDVDPAAPLTRYGLDSLTALELTEAVAAETQYELPEECFFDAPSIQSLALRLLMRSPVESTANENWRTAKMRADSVLDVSIRPWNLPAGQPGVVLLTGANGFVGVHLLGALLDAGAREVICLVRAEDDTAAQARLNAAMRRYGVKRRNAGVRVLAADIGAPTLGLSPSAYRQLARDADAIVHCAAEVNWGATYEQLSPINVEATRGLLRLACIDVAKPFHFVSSVAAGYSSRDRHLPFDEHAPTADPEGLHLGYGQSKWVAERLVETASERGLVTTIYRPTLIAGHSDTGQGNDDDLFSRMLRGCVALGHAPDLDWSLDACPVDYVAQAIALTAMQATTRTGVIHLRNPHPARWTEAVLWMNLRGYAVPLETYGEWVERVRLGANAGHPLQPLRGFLLHKPAQEAGRYLAELYARPHVRDFCGAISEAQLETLGVSCPRLGARLLERYFERWTACGQIDRPMRAAPARENAPSGQIDTALEKVLQRYFGDPALRIEASTGAEFGAEYSLIGEIASWRAGVNYAMQHRYVDLRRSGGTHTRLDLVLKQKLPDAVVLDVARDVASLCDPDLGRAFADFQAHSELAGARDRECAVYAHAGPVTHEHMPLYFGIADRHPSKLVLERVWDTDLSNAVDDPGQWVPERMAAVLTGLAAIHADARNNAEIMATMHLRHAGRVAPVEHTWWAELARYANAWLRTWLGSGWKGLHDRLLDRMEADRRWAATQPSTLIHGDFNPRNFVLRRTALGPKLCAFDWELAAWGLPQRDVAEFLAFTLPADFSLESVFHWIEYSRLALERRAQRSVDAGAWHAGMRVAMADFGTTRLPMYFLAHRFRPQRFLERVTRCWWRLASVIGTQP